jgi:MFS family permease
VTSTNAPQSASRVTRHASRIFTGNVLWLSVVSLLTDLSSEMIYPLLPVFLNDVLRAGPAFLGVIEGIAESTASLLKLASGWVSDRIQQRKLLVLVGYGLASVVRPLIAIASAPWHVLMVRFTDRVGKGIRTSPRDALIADSVDPAHRGAAFGYHRAADHAGAVLGPLAGAGLLFLMPGQYRLVFALAAIPALASVVVLAWKVREAAPVAKATQVRPEFRGFGGLGRRFLLYLLVLVVFTLGNATDAFLLLRARQLGVPVAMILFLWAAFHVSKMVWNVVGGRLADRIGPRPAIIAGWIVYALTYLGFMFANTAWHVWALFGVYGLFYGLTEGPEKALVASMAPADRRGSAFGAYNFAIGIAALPASVMFGLLWQRFGPATAFAVGSGLALVAAIGLAAVPLKRER